MDETFECCWQKRNSHHQHDQLLKHVLKRFHSALIRMKGIFFVKSSSSSHTTPENYSIQISTFPVEGEKE
jgi:hypothetical protein